MVTSECAPTRHGWDCDVEIVEPGTRRRHNVRVSRQDLERWGRAGEEGPEALLQRTFDFLLAREQASQILKSFELADVARYFPEFDAEIRRA
jgi:hypothetical protein